ncbi:hypothetical protein SORBI_3009G094100 [Sorghum bicolor]|uniref:Uncharacterized protein n=1 Tax=Sorghum bicolor TaxID=4558 RepID=A0A1B6P816_SORBI|nr:hypothetical protein SORBI_3009G094100 [Sorghum bicolor]
MERSNPKNPLYHRSVMGGLSRIAEHPNSLDTYQSTNQNFVLFIFCRYFTDTYPTRIQYGIRGQPHVSV